MVKTNIVLMVVDATRVRDLSCYGSDERTSPNIDEIASEGLLFEKCFSQSNRTEPSLTTIMSGKHPLNHGIVSHGTRYTEVNAQNLRDGKTVFLSQILSGAGYTTLAVDWLGRWHNRGYSSYGVEQDFWKKMRWEASNWIKKVAPSLWEMAVKKHRETIGHVDHGPNCVKTTDSAIDLIENTQDNFFLFVHYWDTHAPYSPPGEHENIFHEEGGPTLEELRKTAEERNMGLGPYSNPEVENPEKTLEEIKSAYRGCIHWVDSQVGRFVDYLKDKSLFDETLFILTSDHGENLGEHEIYFKHAGVYDTTIHVPLIMRHPELPSGNVKKLVQHTDLVPTLLDILGVEKPPLLDGHPFDKLNREEVFAEANKSKLRAIRTEKWKYIQPVNVEVLKDVEGWYGREIRPELYSLEKDPEEKENLLDQETDKAKELSERLSEEVKKFQLKHEKSRIKSKIQKSSF